MIMDEFDAVDIVYNAVAAAGTDVMIYKDKSEAGLTNEHIVINHLQLNELDFINKVPINVNIFVPLNENGMHQRQRMKEIKRKVRKSLDSINSNDGVCKEVTIPVYAIGGITKEKMPRILETGAAGGCMMSGFMQLKIHENDC